MAKKKRGPKKVTVQGYTYKKGTKIVHVPGYRRSKPKRSR